MILDEILAAKEREVERLRGERDLLAERAEAAPAPRGFARALEAGDAVAVIAEFKRTSPSAGPLAMEADVAEVARTYAADGAAALSILTEEAWFSGSLGDLETARGATEVPVLRKDFLVDPVQLLEARAAGADAVLLIVRAVADERLRELVEGAEALGMDVLAEAHGPGEVERAVEAGAGVIGVNARDLTSFAVDLSLSERLLGEIPDDRVAVAESGVRGEADVRRMAAAGADAVLVGSYLMRQGAEAVRELVGVPRGGRAGAS